MFLKKTIMIAIFSISGCSVYGMEGAPGYTHDATGNRIESASSELPQQLTANQLRAIQMRESLASIGQKTGMGNLGIVDYIAGTKGIKVAPQIAATPEGGLDFNTSRLSSLQKQPIYSRGDLNSSFNLGIDTNNSITTFVTPTAASNELVRKSYRNVIDDKAINQSIKTYPQVQSQFDQDQTPEQQLAQNNPQITNSKPAQEYRQTPANKLQAQKEVPAISPQLKSGMKKNGQSTNSEPRKKVSFNEDNNQTLLIPTKLEEKIANKEIQDENNQQDAITRSQSQASLSLNEQLSQAQEELAIITDQIENKFDKRDYYNLQDDQEAKSEQIKQIIDKMLEVANITPEEKIILLQEKIKTINNQILSQPDLNTSGDIYKKLKEEINAASDEIATLKKETAQILPTFTSEDDPAHQNNLAESAA